MTQATSPWDDMALALLTPYKLSLCMIPVIQFQNSVLKLLEMCGVPSVQAPISASFSVSIDHPAKNIPIFTPV